MPKRRRFAAARRTEGRHRGPTSRDSPTPIGREIRLCVPGLEPATSERRHRPTECVTALPRSGSSGHPERSRGSRQAHVAPRAPPGRRHTSESRVASRAQRTSPDRRRAAAGYRAANLDRVRLRMKRTSRPGVGPFAAEWARARAHRVVQQPQRQRCLPRSHPSKSDRRIALPREVHPTASHHPQRHSGRPACRSS